MGSDSSCCLSANDLLFYIFLSRCWKGKSKMCLPTVKVMLVLNLLNCTTSKSILIFIGGVGQSWTVSQPVLSSRLASDQQPRSPVFIIVMGREETDATCFSD